MRTTQQLSIDELSQRLALSRSTIYYWIRDLPIPGSGPGGEWPESARRLGTQAMQRKYRLLREAAYRQGLDEFDALSAERTFRDFVSLYIAEGFKRNRNVVEVGNSDPAVMRVVTGWLRRITDRQLRFSIQYHADQDLDELRGFWAVTLAIDPGEIVLQRKSNSGQLAGRCWRSRYGVISVRVSDTLLRARMQAWMDRIKTEWH